MASEIRKQQKYLKKYSPKIKAGQKNVPTYAQWLGGQEPVYFRHRTKETPEMRLKAAGIDWEQDKPSARLKRNK